MGAHSAGRILLGSDGYIYYLGRPSAILRSTIYKRLGSADWTTVPTAPGLDSSPGTGIYGALLEYPTGVISAIYGQQIGAVPTDTNAGILARKWPLWQLRGEMPLIVSPSAPSVTPPGETIQFTARGAGDFVWSLHTNASGGSIDASTGLYTVGSVGSVTDVVRCTDLNGYYVDTNVTVHASSFQPWALATAVLWVDTVNAPPATSGGNLTTWTDLVASATIVPGSGAAVPVASSDASFNNRPSLGLGVSGSYLKTSGNLSLKGNTLVAVLKTAATGYLIVHVNDGASDGAYWYSSSPTLFTTRLGATQSADGTGWAAGIQAGVAKCARATFTGPAAGTKISLNGSNLSVSASGDLDPNTAAVGKLYVGGNQTGGGNLVGDIAAIGVFGPGFSDSDWANVHSYLAGLFGTA
jgi:hypothetical protein